MSYTNKIFPTNKGLTTYLGELMAKNCPIPMFQREVIWEQKKNKNALEQRLQVLSFGQCPAVLKLQNHRQIDVPQNTETNYIRTEYQGKPYHQQHLPERQGFVLRGRFCGTFKCSSS